MMINLIQLEIEHINNNKKYKFGYKKKKKLYLFIYYKTTKITTTKKE